MDAGFEARHLYAACRLTISHDYSPGGSPGTIFGTGFVVGFPQGDSRFGLVTNRHLADAAWAEPQCAGTTLTSVIVEMWQSTNLKLTFELTDPTPFYHHDESIDGAVIPFGPAFDANTTLGTFYDKIENLIPDLNVDSLVIRSGSTRARHAPSSAPACSRVIRTLITGDTKGTRTRLTETGRSSSMRSRRAVTQEAQCSSLSVASRHCK